MTVMSVAIGQPKPGRAEEVLEISRSAKKLIERHGGKNIRTSTAVVSSAAFGSVVNTSEFDDLEAYGAFFDAIWADDELLSLLGQIQGANSPYATFGANVITEVPLGRKRGPNGPIVAAMVSAPQPGRFQAAIELAVRAYDLLEARGARNCRLFSQQASGVQPDVLISATEFDTMRAYGKAMGGFLSDPAGQALAEQVQSSDSPIRMLTSEVFREVAG
jgi:hypothetical protein